jgi:hypothetical protein
MHRFYSKNLEKTEPLEEKRASRPKRQQKNPLTKSEIWIAILWTLLLTPFWDSAHLGLRAHFSYYKKESSGNRLGSSCSKAFSPFFLLLVECNCLFAVV